MSAISSVHIALMGSLQTDKRIRAKDYVLGFNLACHIFVLIDVGFLVI